MSEQEFEQKKRKLFRNLKSADSLNEDLEQKIVDLYGERGERAIEVVKDGRVWRENDCWYVQGREDIYEVVKSHCSCYDYVLNIATEKVDVDMCYHALSKNIKELLDSE